MKRILIISFLAVSLIAITTVVIVSCQKIEKVYSCDSATDKWVRENLKTIQSMNRQDLIQLEPEQQRAAFRAFTPVQRYSCWVDKLEQVKKLEWTDKELVHLCLLSESLKLEWFDDAFKNDKEYSDQIDSFLRQWLDDGMDYFGWTKDELGRMVASLMDVEIENQNVVLKTSSAGGSSSTLPGGGTVKRSCNCSSESDWCGNSEECKDKECEEKRWGCGTVWSYSCDRRCQYVTAPK